MKKIILFAVLLFMMLRGGAQAKPGDTNPLLSQLSKANSDSSRIDLLIQLADYYYNQVALQNRQDSLEFYLANARQMNKRAPSYIFQNRINIISAKYYCEKEPGTDPRTVFFPIIDSCKKTKDIPNERMAWQELGQELGNSPQLRPIKLTCFRTAMQLASQLHDKDAEMAALRGIADIHLLEGKLQEAETELFRILKEENDIHPVLIMYTYDLISELYTQKKAYDKALSYGFKTLKKMEAIGDSTFAFTFYNRLAGIYMFLNKPKEGLEWKRKALTSAWANYPTQVFNTAGSIVSQLIGEGKAKEGLTFIQELLTKRNPTAIGDRVLIQRALGDCYYVLKQYGPAEKCYLETIRLGNDPTHNYAPYEKGYDNFQLGSLHYNSRNFQKARDFLQISLKNYEEFGGVQHINNIHLWLFRTDSLLGDYIGAIEHLEKSNELTNSIYSTVMNKQIEEIHVAYGTEQKDKDLRFLAEKQKLSQLKLQHSESTRNWVIAGASMLLIIAGLLYRLTVIRKRSNRIINNKNDQLQHLVTEKEWLLKEVHHRVKNNLHTVISLLESQAAYLEDDALKANELSKHRIYSMSLIHQQLYKAEDIKTIDMSAYLPELIDYLGESFGTARTIRFHLDIEPIKLGVSQAIPIALIVNEAVTNSIKYAFLPDKPATISISMRQKTDKINLEISDNGIGIDPAVLKAESTSLGLKLMNGLTEDLDGQIRFLNENGTRIIINFIPEALNELSS